MYNNENCYNCNKSDELKIDGSFAFCSRCKINLLLNENITQEEYTKIVTEKISKQFDEKIKKETFSKFIQKLNACI